MRREYFANRAQARRIKEKVVAMERGSAYYSGEGVGVHNASAAAGGGAVADGWHGSPPVVEGMIANRYDSSGSGAPAADPRPSYANPNYPMRQGQRQRAEVTDSSEERIAKIRAERDMERERELVQKDMEVLFALRDVLLASEICQYMR